MGMIKSAVKWFLIAFVVLIVLGVLFGGSDNQTTMEQTKSTTDTNIDTQPANTATQPAEPKMMSPTEEAEKAFDDTLITEDSVSEKDNTPDQNEIKSTDYDQLQLLYNSINENMGYNEVLAIVNSTNLPYSDVKYSEGRQIKVAFDKKVTPQKYAESGDYVSIHFDENPDNENEYIFSTLEYFNNDAFIKIFQYERGTYWSFRDSYEYKGLYINDFNSDYEFEITYDNGNKNTVNWIPAKTKEEQFEYIFTHLD